MNRFTCQYAIVRYMPFIETEEFANIGIVLLAPQANYFGFKLLDRRYARITKFFDDIDAKMFKAVTANLKHELTRVADIIKQHEKDGRMHGNNFANSIFAEVVRTRESIARVGETRVVLTENPEAKLDELFQFYVERNFDTKEYRETVLERDVKELLFRAQIVDKFSARKVGGGDYEVAFPFVQTHLNKAYKVIKPLNLGQSDPSKIIEHGGRWDFRIRELKRRNTIPEKVLFAVEGPGAEGPRKKAYHDVVDMLNRLGVVVTLYQNKDEIIEFARRD
ncbi:MAG: DUF3037 domain-containing protein [Gammaproteobacteria bacterium]|nr:DUF3037 domain-containing protein [Gammaproteobacteria bacterium]